MTTNAPYDSAYAKERLKNSVINLSVSQFKDLIKRAGINSKNIIEWRDENQDTLLHLSTSKKNTDMMRFILSNCNNENLNSFLDASNKFGETAIDIAYYTRNQDAINLLFNAEANIDPITTLSNDIGNAPPPLYRQEGM